MTITGKYNDKADRHLLQKYVECTILGSGGSAEAEDSSYDSDYEAEDTLPRASSTAKSHSDVSRTTSDTLAAEFAEYVTVQHGIGSQVTPPPPTHTPGYTARVEFALKLGYTERLVQAALHKLGPDPGQNELLAELIKLGASAAPKLADTPDETEALLPDAEGHLGHFFHQDASTISSSTNSSTCCTTTTATTTNSSCDSTASQLRPVVIDGSNVAMSHGNKEVFSCRGIKICVDWFRARGHKEITVFVPKWRKEASRPDNPIVDQEILGELERDRLLVFTPSRLVGGKRMVCYDDRYILRLAAELDGIVVSNDNYRDLAQESPEFRKVVEERILMYSFVNDRFMPPDDPLGRSGPTLDNFLRVGPRRTEPAPPCPYAKKCTYGNKCKFRHPERGPHPHKSVTERLVEHAQRHLQARSPSLSLPLGATTQQQQQHQALAKTKSWAAGALSTSSDSSSAAALKSRSVENVTVADSSAIVVSSAAYASQPFPATQNAQAYPSSLGWVAPRVSNPEPEPANMHRKLQRQLTLNPSCDPRLNQLRRYHQQQQQQQLSTSQQQQLQSSRSSQSIMSPPHSAMQNRQLTRHASNDASYPVSMSWDQQQQQQHPQRHRQHHHQHVTRIASAPDSYRAWPPRAAGKNALPIQRLGASDPQLNVMQQQDARRHLHYHLANIFPEEQVQAAMALHPHETDPQQICAAILAMFPKH